ncbi:hypothetical protein SORBI_3005G187800 [Sorghum bicolor]|uniref:Uncharacterized protein n=1 Tax=Sorghum bicolor TaxID=4558 RepID=A0A1B6PTF8_SORBI|nr:hypothetical protein SORBI_3005G187800 [Sorghum bicolor]
MSGPSASSAVYPSAVPPPPPERYSAAVFIPAPPRTPLPSSPSTASSPLMPPPRPLLGSGSFICRRTQAPWRRRPTPPRISPTSRPLIPVQARRRARLHRGREHPRHLLVLRPCSFVLLNLCLESRQG